MARLFDDASSQHLNRTAAVLTAMPISMACWIYPDDGANIGTVMSLDNSGANTRLSLVFRGDAGDVIFANSEVAGSDQAASSTAVTLNAWNHAAVAFASSTSRAAWINGGGKGTNTNSSSPSGLNRTSIGRTSRSSIGQYFSGRVAEAAIWSVELADAEALILALGFEPPFVRPAALADHWPLIGRYSPEIGRRGNDLTVSGAVASDHCRIIRRAAPHVGMQEAVTWQVALSDTITITDTRAVEIGKALSDLLSIADARVVQIGKSLGDVVTINDARAISASVALGDVISLADARAIEANKGLSDTVALQDGRVVSAGKALLEVLDLVDTRSVSALVRLAETLGLTDALIAAIAGTLLLSGRAGRGDTASRTASEDGTTRDGGIG